MKNVIPPAALLTLFFLTSVSAQEEELELYFPNVISGRVGSGPILLYNNVFVLANDGEEEVQVRLQVFTNDGALDRGADLDISGGELESLSEYFRHLLWFGGRKVQGWATLILPAESGVRTLHNLSVRDWPSFRVLATTNTEAVASGRVFQVTLPDFVTSSDPIHAIAIVNPLPKRALKSKSSSENMGPVAWPATSGTASLKSQLLPFIGSLGSFRAICAGERQVVDTRRSS